jgi:2-dehydropantoate 2-reductase
MLQSINKYKKTEIDSINGKLIEIGKKRNVDTKLNELLVVLIKSIKY